MTAILQVGTSNRMEMENNSRRMMENNGENENEFSKLIYEEELLARERILS